MPEGSKKKSIIPSQNTGLVHDVVRHIKLIWLLIQDKRINVFLKILPVASLVYLVSPIDMLPGMVVPVVGALDDAAIIWIGTSLFISLCPEDIVNEHTLSLEKTLTGTWKNAQNEDEIVDAEARDITEDQPK
jgi:uncharacterized membrane protein YkvA (DUF1232 family)